MRRRVRDNGMVIKPGAVSSREMRLSTCIGEAGNRSTGLTDARGVDEIYERPWGKRMLDGQGRTAGIGA